MSIYFAEKKWPELVEYSKQNALIVLPVAQIEEHGPHLPVDTDYRLANEVCRAAVEKASAKIPILLMPGIWSGYSNREVLKWPGAVRVEPETLIALLCDICGSLIETGFKKIVMVNGHGQHKGILEITARKIGDKYDVHPAAVNLFSFGLDVVAKLRKSGPGGMCHACEYETSLMLYLAGELVDMSKAVAEPLRYLSPSKSKGFWSTWALENSKQGVQGDPTVATREMGKQVFEATVSEMSDFFIEYHRFKKPAA